MEFDGQLFDVTALKLPKQDAAIVVATSDASLNQLVSELITPLIHVGFVLTGAVVAATAICTIFWFGIDSTLLEVSSSLEEGSRSPHARTAAATRSSSV